LRFQIEPGHPFEAEVLGLLGRVRAELDEFWQRVSDYNDKHPIDPERRIDVCFYYGQCASELDSETHDLPDSD
jgi:predicted RecB family nuclease